MRFGTLYYYSHLFSVVFVSFTACVHRCCEWELTVAWLYIKPTLVPIDEFFIWRDVVHRLVDLIGYSTITSFHSSIHLVLLYLWTTIIFPYDYNSYSTPYILEIIINLTSRSGSVVELYMWQVPHQSCCLFMLLIQKTSKLLLSTRRYGRCPNSLCFCCPFAAQTRLNICKTDFHLSMV